jgi:putative heme-binding domain-containing protein
MIAGLLVLFLAQAADPLAGLSPAEGKRLFDGQCAVCHGIGGGGSTGPSLQRPVLPRAATNSDLVLVIKDGIPNTQMPGAWQMTDRETRLVAAYVRSIGKVADVKFNGDPARGEELYRKSGCGGCHIVAGLGRGFGPELTSIGLRRGAGHLRQSITEPEAEVATEYMTVEFSTPERKAVKAVRVNEDSFTIQVKELSGRFQSFDKKDLVELQHLPKESLMPSYTGRLKANEVDDLVAYLAGLK